MSIVLKNNIFEFNGDHYLQLQGTAMGTKMAPSYANLFMGQLEPKLQAQASQHINMWKRYIDDIFIINFGQATMRTCKHSWTKLAPCTQLLNSPMNAAMKNSPSLTWPFTKVQNFQETGILDIKTHIKKTNKQLYVHKSSYHPEPCKKAIATGETIRYLRTNSRIETFKNMTSQLKNKLIERGYKATEIKNQIRSINFKDKQTILSSTPHKETKPLVIPIKFNDNNQLIRRTILSNWHLITTDATLNLTFDTKPMIACKKNQSLANKLVRAKIKAPLTITDPSLQPKSHRLDPPPKIQTDLPSLFPKTYPMARCNKPRCKICPKLRLTKTIYNKLCKVNMVIPKYKRPLTCNDKRVVYAIKCAECHETYIGQTMRPLRARIAQHLNCIEAKTTHHMSHHFNKSHQIKHFNFLPLEKIEDSIPPREAERLLQQKETYWIRRLSTLQPFGMNYLPKDTTRRQR